MCSFLPSHLWYAAAAAKSLQSCPTLCDPIDGSPPGSPVPGILQARTLEWVCYFFLHSSVDGCPGCFQVLAVVNSATVNIGVHVSFSVLISSGYMPRSGVAGSYGGFIPSLSKESPCHLLQWLYQFTFPPTVQEGSLFPTPYPAFIYYRFFDDGHSDQCEVMSHCSFDLHFSNNE